MFFLWSCEMFSALGAWSEKGRQQIGNDKTIAIAHLWCPLLYVVSLYLSIKSSHIHETFSKWQLLHFSCDLFQKLRQLYTGEDFPPTIEKTKQKGSQKKLQLQQSLSNPASPILTKKTTSTNKTATETANKQAPVIPPKKKNSQGKRMPLSSQENTQNNNNNNNNSSDSKPGAAGLGYCKGARSDKMSDLAAKSAAGKQNSSPDLINKTTSKVKHVRR